MKKHLVAVFVMAVVMMAGCGNLNSGEEAARDEDQIAENTEQTEENGAMDAEDELLWAKGTQIDGTLFQNLDLDGVGDSDDEAYVCAYQFGDYEEKVTVISIHLGTGETIAQVFPVYGDYSLQTGRVFSEEKDAIILEVCDPTSNYGAAAVFVMNVFPVDGDPIPTVVTRLDTTGPITLANGNVIENSILENNVTSGTEVVDVEGMPRQGVSVYSTGENGQYQEIQRVFYWTDNGWAIISGGTPDISVASVWDREEAVLLSAEDAAVIDEIIESGSWTEGTSDCINDCILYMDDGEIQYHSGCGTFNDTVNEKSLHLTEGQQAEVNEILEKYVALEQGLENAPATEEKPAQSAESSGTPQNGTIRDGKIYIEGFGWVDYEGGGTEGIYAGDMYENGNTIGTMD